MMLGLLTTVILGVALGVVSMLRMVRSHAFGAYCLKSTDLG